MKNSGLNACIYIHTILYFKKTYKYIVIKKKETQRLALYQGSPEEKNIKSFDSNYVTNTYSLFKKHLGT